MTELLIRSNLLKRKVSHLIASVPSSVNQRMNAEICEEIGLLMPKVVEAELAGLTLNEMGVVATHVQHCHNCALEYAWLLKLSLLDELG